MEYAMADLNESERRNEKCWTRDNEITIWNGVERFTLLRVTRRDRLSQTVNISCKLIRAACTTPHDRSRNIHTTNNDRATIDRSIWKLNHR